MLTEDLRIKIEGFIQEVIPEAYLVSLELKESSSKVLSIKVDTDTGISLAQCAQISRKIGQELEEEASFSESYRLEVSSPGVGHPLLLHRQYLKNIGRNLSVHLITGEEVRGTLEEVDDEKIVLKPLPSKHKRGKKGSRPKRQEEALAMEILFSHIKEAKVIIII